MVKRMDKKKLIIKIKNRRNVKLKITGKDKEINNKEI